MPPTMLRRGRPKGSELTVIVLPKKKAKKSKIIQPFCKIKAEDKDCISLECFVEPLSAKKNMEYYYCQKQN
jgi:hypothetical protein